MFWSRPLLSETMTKKLFHALTRITKAGTIRVKNVF